MPIRYAVGWLTLALSLTLTPAITHAQAGSAANAEEQARAHFRLGRAHYDNGDFAQAGIEFEEAYRISQRAALLYNIYLAYRDANDTRKAADALRKYLQLEKGIENRGQLESRLAAMDRALAAEAAQPKAAPAATPAATAAAPKPAPAPAAAPAPLPAAAAPAPEPEPAPAAAVASVEPHEKPFPVLPVVLMGTGGAMIATSIVTGLMASSKHGEWDDARKACLEANTCALVTPTRVAELNYMKSSSQTLALVTDILLFGGLAVAGTGVALFIFGSNESEESPPSASASLACAPGACHAVLRGSF